MRRTLAILVLAVPHGALAVSLTGDDAAPAAAGDALTPPEKPASAAAVPGIDNLGAPAAEEGADAPVVLDFSAGAGGFGADAPAFDTGAISEIGAGDDLYFMLNKSGADDPALLRRLKDCVFDCPDAATRERAREIWRPQANEKKKRGRR